MNSAYVVGATFTIEDLASPTLGKLAGQLEKLDGQIEAVKTNLGKLVPSTLTGQITKVGAAFDALPAQADKAAAGMVLAMDRANLGLTKSSDAMRLGFDATFMGMDAAANKASSGMIAAMERAETGVATSAKAMGTSMGGIFAGMDVGLTSAVDVITAEFSRITKSANRSSRAIGKLRGELSGLSTMSNLPLPQLPGMGGGRGGGGGHRRPGQSSGGFHMAPEAMNTPVGRVSGHGLSGAAIAGAAILGDAIYTAAELEDLVTKILISSQVGPGEQPLTRNKDGKQVADLIKRGAVISGKSIEEVGSMFLGTEREFQGITYDKKIDTMSALLPAIAAEAHFRHESLEEAGVALVGVLHQAGLFDKDDMLKGAKEFQFTTMATPVGLGQFKNALSYTMTPLHGGLGMDTGTIMLLTSLMQSAGISNSKAGTWSRQMFVEAEPSTDVLGPLTKTQVQHNKALSMLGLLGSDGKQNWKVQGEDGKTDWNASVIKMFRELGQGMASIPEGERADVLHRAFGTQGAGAATLFSQPNIIDQMEKLVPKLKAFQGGELSLQEYSQGSTIQQSRIAMQEFQVLMADLGTTLLPPINTVLREFNDKLKALPESWEKTKEMWGLGPKVEDRLGAGPPVPADKGNHSSGDMGVSGGWVPMAYHTSDESSGGVSGAEDTIYRGTLRAFTDFAAGKTVSGGSGGGGGGGGFQNASWGGSGGFGGGFSGGGGGGGFGAANLSGGDATGEHADYIREVAKKYGIDPRAAVTVAASEGLHASWAGGDHGTSFGDFQMHFGGSGIRGQNANGLGDIFNRETGLDARNPANWKAVDEWALKYASKHGWGDWHGAAAKGLYGMMGIGGRGTGGANLSGGAGGHSVNPMLTAMIGRASEIMGVPLGITSGARTEAENRATGGAENSLHMKGWAADLTAAGHAKSDGAFWARVNSAFDQAGAEMGQPHRWGGTFGGRYARDNNHFDLTQNGPVGSFKPKHEAAPIIIQHKTVLDGKIVASNTIKHLAQSMRFPTSMGGPDTYGHYVSPGTPLVDAA